MGIQRPDEPFQYDGVLGPVDAGFFFGDFSRIRRLAFILSDGAAFIAIQVGQDVEQRLGPEDRQFIEERPRRFLGI